MTPSPTRHATRTTGHPTPLVQIIIITAGGTQYALLGPVIQDPQDPEFATITEIEFGPILPLAVAGQMFSSEHLQSLGTELQ
jgi:hypothetical protein